MKAIVLEQFGGVEHLITKELPTPSITPSEVLVKVGAIGINPVDYKTRKGQGAAARMTLPVILGWDVCGTVVEAASTSRYRVGDAVFGLVRFPGEGRAYAEYVAVPEEHLAPKPNTLTVSEAAGMPLAALTAYQALITECGVGEGSRVFIQGASGGVGHLAVQIAKHAGARVIASASGRNRECVLSLGADEFVDYTIAGAVNGVRDIDVCLDCVGGDAALVAAGSVKDGGTLVSLPKLSDSVEAAIAAKRPKVETPWFLVHADGEGMRVLADMVASGALRAHIEREFGFDEMGEAHEFLEHGKVRGKVVVVV